MEIQEPKPIPVKCRILRIEVIVLILFLIFSVIDFMILLPDLQMFKIGAGFFVFFVPVVLLFFLLFLIKSILLFKKDRRCAIKGIVGSIVFALLVIGLAIFIATAINSNPPFYLKLR